MAPSASTSAGRPVPHNSALIFLPTPEPGTQGRLCRRTQPPQGPISPSKAQSSAAAQHPKQKRRCRCHFPLPLTHSIPYHGPMPTRPTIRRSCAGRACPGEGRGTSLPVKGESRGSFPLSLGRRAALGDVPPVTKNRLGVAGRESLGGSAAGRVGPTNAAMPAQVSPWRLPPQGVGAGLALPGCNLFPFVDFSPFSTQAVGPRSARALVDTTCSSLSTFSTPPSGALGLPSGPCLAATTCLPLSTCPSRLKPKLRRVPPGTEEPEKTRATIQFKSNP